MRFSILTCYDLFFSEYFLKLKFHGLDFLISPTYVPKGRENYWESLLNIRSSELQIPILSIGKSSNKKYRPISVTYPDLSKRTIKEHEGYLLIDLRKTTKMMESPIIRGRELFEKKIFGPFLQDVNQRTKHKKIKS